MSSSVDFAKMPKFSPDGGFYKTAQSVTITSTVAGTIYYTMDGSTPTASSTQYTGPDFTEQHLCDPGSCPIRQ